MHGSKVKSDNKVRLSRDVLEKAEVIAAEWGLKNARAAIEAVFRRYADAYYSGRLPEEPVGWSGRTSQPLRTPTLTPADPFAPQCEALDALDELLAM